MPVLASRSNGSDTRQASDSIDCDLSRTGGARAEIHPPTRIALEYGPVALPRLSHERPAALAAGPNDSPIKESHHDERIQPIPAAAILLAAATLPMGVLALDESNFSFNTTQDSTRSARRRAIV